MLQSLGSRCTFFLDIDIIFGPQQSCSNSPRNIKVKSSATSSMVFWLHVPITLCMVLNYSVSHYQEQRAAVGFFDDIDIIFSSTKKSCNSFGIPKFKSIATWSMHFLSIM